MVIVVLVMAALFIVGMIIYGKVKNTGTPAVVVDGTKAILPNQANSSFMKPLGGGQIGTSPDGKPIYL